MPAGGHEGDAQVSRFQAFEPPLPTPKSPYRNSRYLRPRGATHPDHTAGKPPTGTACRCIELAPRFRRGSANVRKRRRGRQPKNCLILNDFCRRLQRGEEGSTHGERSRRRGRPALGARARGLPADQQIRRKPKARMAFGRVPLVPYHRSRQFVKLIAAGPRGCHVPRRQRTVARARPLVPRPRISTPRMQVL